jgi:hypothetical protein
VTAGDDGAGLGGGTRHPGLHGRQAAALQARRKGHDAVGAALRHVAGLVESDASNGGRPQEEGERGSAANGNADGR